MDSTNTKIKNAGKLMVRSWKIKLTCIILIILQLAALQSAALMKVNIGYWLVDNVWFIFLIISAVVFLIGYSFLIDFEIAKIFSSVEE